MVRAHCSPFAVRCWELSLTRAFGAVRLFACAVQQRHTALAQILSVIQSAPDDKTRRAAEAELKKRELASGFPIVLLQIVAAPLSADANTQKVQNAVKWQAAIYFKNYVKRMWAPARDRDDDVKAPAAAAGAGAAAAGAAAGAPVDPISANDRELVKKNLAMLMLTAPPQVKMREKHAAAAAARRCCCCRRCDCTRTRLHAHAMRVAVVAPPTG